MRLRRPKFKSHLQIELVEPDLMVLLYETGHRILKSRLYPLIVPFIDGQHSVEEIVRELEGRATVLDVHFGLSQLEEDGFIVENEDASVPALAGFRDWSSVDPTLFDARLKNTVSVNSLGSFPIQPFVSILQSLHLQTAENGPYAVVLVDDYLSHELERYNRRSLEQRRTWMMVKPVGRVLWIGPIFKPGITGCWSCLAHRIRQNRHVESFVLERRGGDCLPTPLSKSYLTTTCQLALNLAATEVLKWVVNRGHEGLEGQLVTLDTQTLILDRHRLVALEHCPTCGQPESGLQKTPSPLVLSPRKKVFIHDGGHRSSLPEQTFRKFQHHVSPITGIVDKLELRSSEEKGLINVYWAGHFFPAVRRGGSGVPTRYRKSAGKGVTQIQARTSALCEALERYSGVFRGDEIRSRATFKELGDEAIHPNRCMNFSQSQYHNRATWNRLESQYNWVPNLFEEEAQVEWTPVWSLTRGNIRYLPTAFCYFGYPIEKGQDFCRADSNGNAAGGSIEEAILQGFLELVERDSVAVWWYNRVVRPGVDLESFDQPYFNALVERYQTLGRTLDVLDITGDFEIPTFAAVSRKLSGPEDNLILGFGTHFDPQLAIQRALTELSQFLPSVVTSVRPFGDGKLEGRYLEPDVTVPKKRGDEYASVWSLDLKEDIERCVELARNRDLEVLVLDQSRSDVGLSVAKVIVPGLRQFWARFAPGRLYDQPVHLEWFSSSLAEEQLNPVHLFL